MAITIQWTAVESVVDGAILDAPGIVVGAGDGIVVLIDARDGDHAARDMEGTPGVDSLLIESLTDGALQRDAERGNDGQFVDGSAWSLNNPTVATHTIRATFNGNVQRKRMLVGVVSGGDPANVVNAGADRFVTSLTGQDLNITPTEDDSLVIGHKVANNAAPGFSNYRPSPTTLVEDTVTQVYGRAIWTHQQVGAAAQVGMGVDNTAGFGVKLAIALTPGAVGPVPDHTDIDGSTWPDDGSPADETTVGGIQELTGNWTHEAPTAEYPLPPWAPAAAGSILLPAGESGSIVLNAPARRFATAPHHIARLSIRLRKEYATGSEPDGQVADLINVGADDIRFRLETRNDGLDRWTGVLAYGSSSSATDEQLPGVSFNRPPLAPDVWYDLHILAHEAGGTDGWWALTANGVLLWEAQDADTAALPSSSDASWRFTLPAIPGARWEISAPLQTSDDEANLGLVPRWDYQPAELTCRLFAFTHWQTKTTQGRHLYPADWTGVTRELFPANLRDGRYVLQAGKVHTIDLQYPIGELPYNADGWATLVWRTLKYDVTTFPIWYIRAAGGSILHLIDITPAQEVRVDGVVKFTLPAEAQYIALGVSLHRDGDAEIWAISHTRRFGGGVTGDGRVNWLGTFTWTPQPLGSTGLDIAFAVGTAEVGSFGVYSHLGLSYVDSLTATSEDVNGLAHERHNRLTLEVVKNDETFGLPNCGYPRRAEWADAGLSPPIIHVLGGRSGASIEQFGDNPGNPGNPEDIPAGAEIHIMEAVMNSWRPDYAAHFAVWRRMLERVYASGGRAWLYTMIDRPYTRAEAPLWNMIQWDRFESTFASAHRPQVEALAREFGTWFVPIERGFTHFQNENPDGAFADPPGTDNIHIDDRRRWWDAVVAHAELKTVRALPCPGFPVSTTEERAQDQADSRRGSLVIAAARQVRVGEVIDLELAELNPEEVDALLGVWASGAGTVIPLRFQVPGTARTVDVVLEDGRVDLAHRSAVSARGRIRLRVVGPAGA